jgi:hypothetical protein
VQDALAAHPAIEQGNLAHPFPLNEDALDQAARQEPVPEQAQQSLACNVRDF